MGRSGLRAVEQDWVSIEDFNLETLKWYGERLDSPDSCGAYGTAREFLAVSLLKLRDKEGRIVPLRMNAAQREFEARRGQRNIVLKARQLGMTTWVAARFFLNTITRPGTLSVQVAHDRESAEEIFRIVHRLLENLPGELREGALRTSRANVRQIVFPRLDSEYRVETAADPNAGRGLTIQNLHCSEVARWPGRAEETLASLRAAVAPGAEIILESTPAGASGAFYREWQEADTTGYVRHFFPWWYEPRYRIEGCEIELTDEEAELASRHGLGREQIAFRRSIQKQFGKRAREEFAEDAASCFLASGDTFFNLDGIDARLKSLPKPLEVRDGRRLEIYWPVQPRDAKGRTREYIVAVDPAGGGSEGDYAAIQVVDREAGWQCAEWYGKATPREIAMTAAALSNEYNQALLVVERNNHGHAVLAYLENVAKYERVYRDEHGSAGWLTTAVTRPAMLENLAEIVEGSPELIGSRRLLDECRTFVRHRNGNVAAASGAHDDAIMALAIALEVRRRVAGKRV